MSGIAHLKQKENNSDLGKKVSEKYDFQYGIIS